MSDSVLKHTAQCHFHWRGVANHERVVPDYFGVLEMAMSFTRLGHLFDQQRVTQRIQKGLGQAALFAVNLTY